MFALKEAEVIGSPGRGADAYGDGDGQDLRRVPDERLAREIVDLERRIRGLQAARLRRIAEVDRRRRVRGEGQAATASWLARTLGVSFTSAREDVRVGRALEDMAVTAAALSSGAVSATAVSVLARARDEQPQGFEADEEALVAYAASVSPGELIREVRRWSEAVDPDSSLDRSERLRRRRRLRVSSGLDGMVRIEGDLDPETAEPVVTALRAIRDADARRTRAGPVARGPRLGLDDRTSEQRMADALGELSRQWLDGSARGRVAGERPHVTVTIGLDELRRPRGQVAVLGHGGAVPASLARRVACDATVVPMVLGARSEPLDVGRKTPVVPPAIRRAVVQRDQHCRFPACDRPQAWCDAHHVVHWADGGATALDNLVLLCRAHHRSVHEGIRLSMTRAGLVFRSSDGTHLEDRAPP